MTKSEINNYKQILEISQAELTGALQNRDAITIEKSADALDEVQNAGERELAIRNLDRESILLRNIRAALRRIAESTFGICLRCEEDINPKRLLALTWAPYCIRCQENIDKERQVVESREDPLTVA